MDTPNVPQQMPDSAQSQIPQALPQAPAYMPPAPTVDASASQGQPSETPGATPEAQQFHGSVMGNVTRSILSALGGSQKTTYQVDPNTGKITQEQAPASPGDQWRTILAGALTGLAAGAGVHGPGGAGESAARGFTAGNQVVQQRQQQQQKKAEFQSNQIQQEKLNQASMALNQQKIAANTFKLAGQRLALTDQFVKDNNDFQKFIQSSPGAEYQGYFKDEQAVAQATATNPQLIKDHVAGTQILHTVIGHDKDGNPVPDGIEVWNVPKQWMQQPSDHDVHYTEQKVDPATGKVQYVDHVIPKGSITNADAIQIGQKNIQGAITPASEANNDTKAEIADVKATAQEAINTAKIASRIRELDAKNQPLEPTDTKAISDMIGNYQLDAKQARYMFKAHPEILAQVQRDHPDFSEMNYAAGEAALKSFANGGTNNKNLVAAQAAIQHASQLNQLVSKLPVTNDLNVLNRAIAASARQLGFADITNVDTLADAVSGEMGKSITGGVPDKDTLEKMRSHLEAGERNVPQIQGALKVLVHANAQKLDGLAETLHQVPNIQNNRFAPRLSDDTKKALQTFGYQDPFDFSRRDQIGQNGQVQLPKGNGGQLTDAGMAKKFLDAAGGDKAKARTLAAQNGWKF